MNEENCLNPGYSEPVEPSELRCPNWRSQLRSENPDLDTVINGLTKIRKYLCQTEHASQLIDNVLSTEFHKALMQFSKKVLNRIISGDRHIKDILVLQESTWIFTNLCSGGYQSTKQVLEIGVTDFCHQIFNISTEAQLIHFNFELLGNIAGELNLAVKLRFLRDKHFFELMSSKYCELITTSKTHEDATWAFSNLFRDYENCKDSMVIEYQNEELFLYYPIIQNLLNLPINSEQSIMNLLFAIFYLTKENEFYPKETVEIIEGFLHSPVEKIVNLVIQIFGNLIANGQYGVEYALQHQSFLQLVMQKLKHGKTRTKKECGWVISNIFAGTLSQVERFVSIPNLFIELQAVLENQKDESILKELIWSISNSFSSCNEVSFQMIFSSSIIEQLSLSFIENCTKFTSIKIYLEAISNYLEKFQKNPNLNFQIFQKNTPFIKNGLEHSKTYSDEISFILQTCDSSLEKIQQLLERGPINEEEMVHNKIDSLEI